MAARCSASQPERDPGRAPAGPPARSPDEGAELLSRIEGTATLAGAAWHAEVVRGNNSSLSRDFSTNPDAQLLDKMFRDPDNAGVLLDKMERGTASPFRIAGTSESYAVSLGADGSVTTSLNGRGYRMAPDGSRTVVGATQPLQAPLHRAAMAQLGPALLASGRSAQEVDTLVAACVSQCAGHGDPQKFLLSKDGVRVAMVYPDQPIRELSVEAALAQGHSQGLTWLVQPAGVASPEPRAERVR